MAFLSVAHGAPVTRRIEQISGIRPVTLLIASGIVLVIAILTVTGIAANQLRAQALATGQSELWRIGGILAADTDRTLRSADSGLADVAARVAKAAAADPAVLQRADAPEIVALLQGSAGRPSEVDAIGLVTAGGQVLDRAGAWPAEFPAARDLIAALRAAPDRASVLGDPLRDPLTGAVGIPIAHRVDGPAKQAATAVIGILPLEALTRAFETAALAPDASILLVRRHGPILARFGEAETLPASEIDRAIGPGGAAVLGQTVGQNGRWLIFSVHLLPDYQVAFEVSRLSGEVLDDWSHQLSWFLIFALVGVAAITAMVYLIARQFKAYETIAAMRAAQYEAEKIEIDRARLAAEAEVLKSERLSVLGQLTATVAHELRNPLSAIRNTLFTVRELATAAGAKLDRPIARMERSIERCDRIISDLLEYTRHRELKRGRVAFDRWLGDLLAEQSLPAGVSLATEFDAGATVVPVDSDRIRRVVINLVENAAQALGELPPERDKRVAVRTVIENGELVLTIEDTGPGISPENLPRIFEPLFSTKTFGTGLGLPTVKQIVNQHGGTIAVDSEIGRGTRMTVRLPLGAAVGEEVKVMA